ncbi:hypothetical protein DSO57_1012622 [Entomophthora muscae]|uniref:Uncharacterized protein n=1 Tax=Entomophthora muscae TaxID=34485 RepID=A0ACC2RKP7_9FUNG|nr:hypothetical protein DSO57_1012622 [Entomophthora muscae]
MSPVSAIQTQQNVDGEALVMEQVHTAASKKAHRFANQTSKSGSNKEELSSSDLLGQQSEKKETSKNKICIRYTTAELLALSKSPLCQPPNPMPVLDGKKYCLRRFKLNIPLDLTIEVANRIILDPSIPRYFIHKVRVNPMVETTMQPPAKSACTPLNSISKEHRNSAPKEQEPNLALYSSLKGVRVKMNQMHLNNAPMN